MLIPPLLKTGSHTHRLQSGKCKVSCHKTETFSRLWHFIWFDKSWADAEYRMNVFIVVNSRWAVISMAFCDHLSSVQAHACSWQTAEHLAPLVEQLISLIIVLQTTTYAVIFLHNWYCHAAPDSLQNSFFLSTSIDKFFAGCVLHKQLQVQDIKDARLLASEITTKGASLYGLLNREVDLRVSSFIICSNVDHRLVVFAILSVKWTNHSKSFCRWTGCFWVTWLHVQFRCWTANVSHYFVDIVASSYVTLVCQNCSTLQSRTISVCIFIMFVLSNLGCITTVQPLCGF